MGKRGQERERGSITPPSTWTALSFSQHQWGKLFPKVTRAHLENLVGWGQAPIALPVRHRQKSCHLSISAVCDCQRFVAASAESGARSEVDFTLTDSHRLLRVCPHEEALPSSLPCRHTGFVFCRIYI